MEVVFHFPPNIFKIILGFDGIDLQMLESRFLLISSEKILFQLFSCP